MWLAASWVSFWSSWRYSNRAPLKPSHATCSALPWFLILGAFMLVGWFATRTAQTSTSLGMQYFSYAAYVVVEALIFVPLLYIANAKAPGAIDSATLVTALGAAGLMLVAHRTRKDFSFLRAILMWGGVLAIVAMIGGAIFGFQLGTWFSVAMIGFAGAAVLYDTSNIIHVYPRGSLRGRGHAVVRLNRADVLVCAAPNDGQPQLSNPS